jgi:tRNA G46 methylase TrmB
MSGVNNLAILCGDANEIIPMLFPAKCVSSVFINHPQPPERDDKGKKEYYGNGKHLLTSFFFRQIHRILTLNGTITIVTDSQQYAHCIVQTLRKELSDLFYSPDTRNSDLIEEVVKSNFDGAAFVCTEGKVITLLRGNPSAVVGHETSSSSYFDRLWNNGEMVRRWIIYIAAN